MQAGYLREDLREGGRAGMSGEVFIALLCAAFVCGVLFERYGGEQA